MCWKTRPSSAHHMKIMPALVQLVTCKSFIVCMKMRQVWMHGLQATCSTRQRTRVCSSFACAIALAPLQPSPPSRVRSTLHPCCYLQACTASKGRRSRCQRLRPTEHRAMLHYCTYVVIALRNLKTRVKVVCCAKARLAEPQSCNSVPTVW